MKEVNRWTDTPIVAATRSEHMEDVGFLLAMFSNRRSRCPLHNFDIETANAFALETAREAELNAANSAEVIEKIVDYSKGNPGAIKTMIRMAASPKYLTEQHVKLSPLYIDFRMSSGARYE